MEHKGLPDITRIYDAPIHTSISQIELMIKQEYTDQIVKAVGQVGIEINEKGLVEAINQDRKRYEEAYQRGWNDCKAHYADKIDKIDDYESKIEKISQIICSTNVNT